MGSNIPKRKHLDQLRKRAEVALNTFDLEYVKPSRDDFKKLLHELGTYQIELELQNEDLRNAQIELTESRDRYSDLYDFAPVGYLTLSEKGIITQANLTAAEIFGVERSLIINKPFSSFIPCTRPG